MTPNQRMNLELCWSSGFAAAFGAHEHPPLDSYERRKAHEAGVQAGNEAKHVADERAKGYAAIVAVREIEG